jgi:site-specific DNA-methyltransferase (adenine-specific)
MVPLNYLDICGMNQGKSISEGYKSKNETRIHPTQKTVNLYKWLLMNYAKQGDKILNMNVWSASSLIAYHEIGFDFLGFELDKNMCDLASKRLSYSLNRLNMFCVMQNCVSNEQRC